MRPSTLMNTDEYDANITDKLLNTINDGRLLNPFTNNFESYPSQTREYSQPSTLSIFDATSGHQTVAEKLYELISISHRSKQFSFSRATAKTEDNIHMFKNHFQLNNNYKIENMDQVFSFLDKHEHLVAFLLEAASQIQDIFGHVTLKLRLRQDLEHPEDLGLIGEIYADLSVDDALSKLDEFDHKWFLNNARKTEGKVQFDVEWC